MSLETLHMCVAQAVAQLTISSIEFAEKVVELKVAERFESKHLPIEIQIGNSEKTVPSSSCRI